jgi:hypothetical protein
MMHLTLTNWILVFFATAYATYAITDNDGPLHIFRHVRAGIDGLVDKLLDRNWQAMAGFVESFKDLMDCYVCLSFWIALGILNLVTQDWLFIHALAVAGVYVGVRKFFDGCVTILTIPNRDSSTSAEK